MRVNVPGNRSSATRLIFKQVRELGMKLGIPEHLVFRHPFPGPGLGIRITGPIDVEKLRIARQADKIFMDEIIAAGLYRQISQAFAAVLGGVQAVAVMGDKRSYQECVCLRAVTSVDFMTCKAYRFEWEFLENVSNRIVNEVPGCSRVFYDGQYLRSSSDTTHHHSSPFCFSPIDASSRWKGRREFVCKGTRLLTEYTATSKPPATIELL